MLLSVLSPSFALPTEVTLKGANATATWNPFEKSGEYPGVNYKLFLRQILLGHEAKPDEYNVIEATIAGPSAESVVTPIAVLKPGEIRSIHPDLEFPEPPVKMTLIKGAGPVHIHGYWMETQTEYFDEGDDGEEEDEDDEEAEEVKAAPIKESSKKGKK